jgi:2-oxoglutarate/2-oxoacid ferredoxin oxidoreductase subunit beta
MRCFFRRASFICVFQANEGHPVKMCEVLAVLPGTSYLERVSVHKPAAIVKTKKAIRKAFEHQIKGTGFSMVEILSPCPTNWHMGTVEPGFRSWCALPS